MKIIGFFLSLIAISFACQNQSQTQTPPAESEAAAENTPQFVREIVSLERFKSLMAASDDFQLIDVRTPEEYAAGHIEGALNLNFRDADFDNQLLALDKTKPVFVYCKSGGRSGQAAAKMQTLEFHQVFDLEGGFEGWEE